jgi:serine/threonine-protein kinase RsbW
MKAPDAEGAMEESRPTSPSSLDDQVEFEIRCPISTQILAVIRDFVTSLARQMGFDEEAVDQIELAVDEACANVVRHAYKHLGVSPDLSTEKQSADLKTIKSCTLWVRLHLGDQFLKITIIDHGIGINSEAKGVNTMEEFAERGGSGGLGMYIIRNFMDEVEYSYPPSGTVLTMTKYLNSESRFPN